MNKLLTRVPENIRSKLGASSRICLLNGRDVFTHLQQENLIVMACNPRIIHVIPGIMKAAEELDAVIAFELTRTEGGVDGGYTGLTPEIFVNTLIDYAERCKFTRPFIITADHITVKDTSLAEQTAVAELIAAQLAAGYTSFSIDASFNPLAENISLVTKLAKPVIAAGFGLELELGEVTPVGSISNLTTVTETKEFLTGVAAQGVKPQLLAINNGSKSGNYLEGEIINIDLPRTSEIYQVARDFGLTGLVQHGITGTSLRIVGKLAEFGIRKGNIGTLWQNVAHAGFPLDLMDAMRQWSRGNKRDIKYATGVFKANIDNIPAENIKQIEEMANWEAREFILAFRAKGSAGKLAEAMNAPN